MVMLSIQQNILAKFNEVLQQRAVPESFPPPLQEMASLFSGFLQKISTSRRQIGTGSLIHRKTAEQKNKPRGNAPKPHTRYPFFSKRNSQKTILIPYQLRQNLILLPTQRPLHPRCKRQKAPLPQTLRSRLIYRRRQLRSRPLCSVLREEIAITNGDVWRNRNHRHVIEPLKNLPLRSKPGTIPEKPLKHMRIGLANFNVICATNRRISFPLRM